MLAIVVGGAGGKMRKDDAIYVAGHTGLVGSAVVRALKAHGFKNLVLRTHAELDLASQEKVAEFFKEERPEYVFHTAARVGGILENSMHQADFLYLNTLISFNIIKAGKDFGVKKLVNLGSTCIYPKNARQPLREEYLLDGKLEPTNEGYAVAKISAIKLCRYMNEQYGTDFISAMPTNLYGPNDNFDLQSSHVLPAIMRKMHDAKVSRQKSVVLWGSGKPRREFLHVDDLADCLLYLMQNKSRKEIGEFVNVGTGEDVTIRKLAELVEEVTGFEGKVVWDRTKPDGTPRKLTDVRRLHSLGWKHKIPLEKGVRATYRWFLDNHGALRGGR